jgi:ribonuclease-3
MELFGFSHTHHNIANTSPPSMSSQKRGNASNHYGDRNQHFNKKQRPNQPSYSSASYDDRNGSQYGKPQQRGNFIPQQRNGVPLDQPELTATEMQTGLVALLDRFVAAEMTPDADKDILHHARELRRLVAARNAKSVSAQAKRDLEQKRPDKAANVIVPDYIHRKVVAAKDLPPLPPITEPHLHEAVFTHKSIHANHQNVHQHVDMGLDYERLEFLGDAYIELIASRALFNRFPTLDVPQMCSWRERLVENLALGKFSEAYGFPDRLKTKIELGTDSKAYKKVVADIFEAYVAGVVLSDPKDGFATAEDWLDELWAPQLLGFQEKVVENVRARDDLQKMLVLNGIDLKYKEEKPMVMEKGLQKYFLGVYLTGWGYENEWLGSGEGQKKAQACISAATDALKRNSEVLQNAARQKKELMEVKAKEREEQAQAAAENGKGEDNDTEEGETTTVKETKPTERAEEYSESFKKRKSDNTDNSSEKKSKKHKKDKKEKKEKHREED